MYRQLTPLSEILAIEQWPVDLFQNDDLQNLLDSTYVVDYLFSANAQSLSASITLIFEGEVAFEIPGLSGISLVVGVPDVQLPEPPVDEQPPGDELPGGAPDDFPFDTNLLEGWTQLSLGFNLLLENGEWSLSIYDLSFELRIDSTLLKPVDGSDYVAIGMRGDVSLDQALNFTVRGFDEYDLAACEIGDLGLILSAQGVSLDLSRLTSPAEIETAGFNDQFIGIFLGLAAIQLPEVILHEEGTPIALEVFNFVIGNGGIGGILSIETAIATKLFSFQFVLTQGSVELEQNSITLCSLQGEILIPFFDQPLELMLGFGNDGSFYAALSQGDADGLFTLDIPFLGTFTLSSLGFVTDEGEAGLLLSGILQLEVLSPLLQWPAIELFELRIGAGGEVQLPDGWIDLQEPVALDLFGFRLEITRIGFGNTDDGRRWVGFSGGVQLVEFLPTGASVEGLRVIWDPSGDLDPEITLQGVGVELTLPGVLEFAGDVAFINEESVSYFQGNAKLNLLPLGIELDASLKIGRDLDEGYKFVYTFMSLELPIGLPLWATGAALYGIAGLYGMNVNPTAENSDWYGWYAGLPEQFNVTHSGKWKGLEDGKALGAGMTLGTLFDVGQVVTVKGLFALILPGPVILVHGKANFLATPPDASEPTDQGCSTPWRCWMPWRATSSSTSTPAGAKRRSSTSPLQPKLILILPTCATGTCTWGRTPRRTAASGQTSSACSTAMPT
jgi:hypothetical protein